MNTKILANCLFALLVLAATSCTAEESNAADGYQNLLALFEDWREFETPPLRDGAPDYTAERFETAHAELKDYQSRLNAIETNGWPIDAAGGTVCSSSMSKNSLALTMLNRNLLSLLVHWP